MPAAKAGRQECVSTSVAKGRECCVSSGGGSRATAASGKQGCALWRVTSTDEYKGIPFSARAKYASDEGLPASVERSRRSHGPVRSEKEAGNRMYSGEAAMRLLDRERKIGRKLEKETEGDRGRGRQRERRGIARDTKCPQDFQTNSSRLGHCSTRVCMYSDDARQ